LHFEIHCLKEQPYLNNFMQPESRPLVSVLIPLYNAEEYIGGAIESCLNQSYKNIEVVVVDDHSTDRSLSIAKQYESDRVHVLSNPKKGAQTARNYAYECSKGRLVKFHDADDYSTPGLIEKQVDRMLQDGDDDTMVYSLLHQLEGNGEMTIQTRMKGKDYFNPIDFAVDMLRAHAFYCPHCYLLTRKTVDAIGGWNENVRILQDRVYFVKAAEVASKVLFVDGEYAVWRVFDDGVHIHSQKTPDKMKNAIETICDMAQTVLRYKDNADTREVCETFIGRCIYFDFPSFRPILPYVNELCTKNGLKWVKFRNERFNFLYSLLGWERTTALLLGIKKTFGK